MIGLSLATVQIWLPFLPFLVACVRLPGLGDGRRKEIAASVLATVPMLIKSATKDVLSVDDIHIMDGRVVATTFYR